MVLFKIAPYNNLSAVGPPEVKTTVIIITYNFGKRKDLQYVSVAVKTALKTR